MQLEPSEVLSFLICFQTFFIFLFSLFQWIAWPGGTPAFHLMSLTKAVIGWRGAARCYLPGLRRAHGWGGPPHGPLPSRHRHRLHSPSSSSHFLSFIACFLSLSAYCWRSLILCLIAHRLRCFDPSGQIRVVDACTHADAVQSSPPLPSPSALMSSCGLPLFALQI